ncbi:hypothetical protein EMIT053CA3_130029 [Pseudomonas donghuensis]
MPPCLRDHAASELMVDGSSANSIPSLQYGEGGAASAIQISGRGEPGKPGADDDHVQYILRGCLYRLGQRSPGEPRTTYQRHARERLHKQAPAACRWRHVFTVHFFLGTLLLYLHNHGYVK